MDDLLLWGAIVLLVVVCLILKAQSERHHKYIKDLEIRHEDLCRRVLRLENRMNSVTPDRGSWG